MILEFPIEDVIEVDVDGILGRIEQDYNEGYSITSSEIRLIVREYFDDCWEDYPYTEEMVQKTIATVTPLWSERLFKLQTIDKRVKLVKAMQDYIFDIIGDEDYIDGWIAEGIPDEASDEEIAEIVKDAREFTELVDLFYGILANYLIDCSVSD